MENKDTNEGLVRHRRPGVPDPKNDSLITNQENTVLQHAHKKRELMTENVILRRWQCRLLILAVAILSTFLCFSVGYFLLKQQRKIIFSRDIVEDIGLEALIIFRQYDRNDDGYLSLEEFEPLAHRLLEENITVSIHSHIILITVIYPLLFLSSGA